MTFLLILENTKNCHLLVTFSMPLRILQTFVRSLFSHLFPRLMSPIRLCCFLYRSCSINPSPNFPSLLLHFWDLHMILKWNAPSITEVAPGHSVYLSVPFPVWLFLAVHLLLRLLLSQSWGVHPRTCLSLKILFVISQNSPFIFILCWLSFNKLFIHARTEFGDRPPEAF